MNILKIFFSQVYGCALPEISSDDKDKNEELDIYSLGVFLAPKDVQPITFTPKDNYHGIGYSGINLSTTLFAGASSLEEAFRPTGNDRRGIRGQVGALPKDISVSCN